MFPLGRDEICASAARSEPYPTAYLPSCRTFEPQRRQRLSATGPLIDTALGLIACFALIAANAVFVAGEFSLVAADRVRIEAEAAEGKVTAKRVLGLSRNLSLTLAATQLGITVASLLLGFLAEPAVRRVLDPVLGDTKTWSVVVSLLLATIFQTVLGEVVPKNLAISSPNATARALAFPVWLFGVITGPVTRLFNGIANRIVRAFGVEPRDELSTTNSMEELALLIKSSGEAGALEPEDVTLLTRSIRFGEKTAEDVLVPRVQIEALHRATTLTDLVAKAVATNYSRFPVFGRDLDDIVGVVHAKSVFTVPRDQWPATLVASIMHAVLAVPERRDLADLFHDFRSQRSYLAVVVDEHGGTAGIITLEDVLEELVGEIGDEYDTDEDTTSLPSGNGQRGNIEESDVYLLAGSLHHDEVREQCGLHMPDGEFETLAGFVLDQLGRVPVAGESFSYDGWLIEVVSVERRRVVTVRLVAPYGHHFEPAEESR